jgi:membrane-associated protease RseP (regulator of RpoE activity)
MAGARMLWLTASLGVALGLVLGAAVGVRLAPEAESTRAVSATGNEPAARDPRIAQLEAEVARWRAAYEELAREKSPAAAASDTKPSPPPAPTQGATAAQPTPGLPVDQPFDTAALQARGYTEQEAQRLADRYEAYELALLYLNDRAQREGWQKRPRFQMEQQKLANELRIELGDRDYDAVLYASGQDNRVQVAGVLGGSPAEHAGLRDGDEIVSYDGRRIFDPQALVGATSQGQAGAQVEIVVRRDGQDVHLVMPRGPIGVRLQRTRVQPDGFL